MSYLTYIPAVGTSDLDNGTPVEELKKVFGYNQNFLDKDKSSYYYPQMLISYYYGRKYKDLRGEAGLSPEIKIKGDSGGFQNITQDANLDPLDVITWQQKNCDTGLILDCPPFKKIEGSAQFGETTPEVFTEALNKTIVNAKVALDNWTNPDFTLMGVIQGDTVNRQEEWTEAMLQVEKDKGREFAGWSLSPKPSHDIKQIATHAANLIDRGMTDKPIHILQISGFESLAMSCYVAKFFKSTVTVDSSTATVGRQYFTYFDPYEFKNNWDFGARNTVKLKTLACDCPVCNKIEHKHLTYDEWDTRSPPGFLITLHNLYQIIKYVKYLNAIRDDEEIFRKFCFKHFGQKFLNVMDYIDEVAKFGKQESYRKNVIKSQKLTNFFNQESGAEEVDQKALVEEKLEMLRKEFPGVKDSSLKVIAEHRGLL